MKVSLKKRKLKAKTSLYIEYYKGSYISKEGKRVHDREHENLKIQLHNNPLSPKEKRENKENLELAENILAIRKADYLKGKYDIQNDNLGHKNFLEFYVEMMEERYASKANYDNWDACLKHLQKFCTPSLKMNQVDEKFIKGFKNYLDRDALTKATKNLSQNSKYSYYNKFKACLRGASEKKYISESLLKYAKGFKEKHNQREYLTFDELIVLTKTECRYKILKKAFIFSCLTAIRWSDIQKLTWKEVRDESNEIFKINFTQKKTDQAEYLYISKQSRELLGNREKNNERVFVGLHYSSSMNTELLRWCMSAGISKHITFHSARHTNAVLLLEHGADIYTVQKRLGHKEIRTTQVYARIIDKKMKESAYIIPQIEI